MTGLRSISVLTLINHFHSLWCGTDFVLHGWLTGARVEDPAAILEDFLSGLWADLYINEWYNNRIKKNGK